MFVWDDEWLNRRIEPVIDSERVIVDPHHHLWTRPGAQTYLVDDLQADTESGHRVVKTVFIEASWAYRPDGPHHLRPVGETVAAANAAEESRVSGGAEIAGIVGRVDMMSGALVGDALDAHTQAAHGLFRGVRHSTACDPNRPNTSSNAATTPGMIGRDDFRAGVRAVAARGLSFDAWLYHPQIPEVTAMARAVPECTIVLDHLGGLLGIGSYAGKRAEILSQWRVDLAELSACPNVNVKLGGLGMTMFGLGYRERAEAPTSEDLFNDWVGPVRYAIEHFGAERCMFESNFPVDREGCSYRTLWNAFKRMAADASPNEKDALFSGTATRVYRL